MPAINLNDSIWFTFLFSSFSSLSLSPFLVEVPTVLELFSLEKCNPVAVEYDFPFPRNDINEECHYLWPPLDLFQIPFRTIFTFWYILIHLSLLFLFSFLSSFNSWVRCLVTHNRLSLSLSFSLQVAPSFSLALRENGLDIPWGVKQGHILVALKESKG